MRAIAKTLWAIIIVIMFGFGLLTAENARQERIESVTSIDTSEADRAFEEAKRLIAEADRLTDEARRLTDEAEIHPLIAEAHRLRSEAERIVSELEKPIAETENQGSGDSMASGNDSSHGPAFESKPDATVDGETPKCSDITDKQWADFWEREQRCIAIDSAGKEFLIGITGGSENPNLYLTQSDMNIGITEQNKIERRRMNSLVQKVMEHLTEKQAAEFLKANEAWEAFALASAEVAALEYEGGSIQPLIWGRALFHLAKERNANLEELIETVSRP